MKRVAFVLVILVLMSSTASAKGLSFGVKGGLFTANTTAVPQGMYDSSFKNGFAGGVYLNYTFSNNVGLQQEFLYVMKGFKGSLSSHFMTKEFTGTYDYIEMPLLGRLTIPTGSRVSPYVFVGPSLGINLKADIQADEDIPALHQHSTESTDYSGVTRKTELSLVFGAGLGCAVGPGEITFDARFDLGLSNVTTGGEVYRLVNGVEQTETIAASTSKNIGFALLLGYAF